MIISTAALLSATSQCMRSLAAPVAIMPRAGRLIEAAGLKGRRSGGAQISPKHANFIVNVDHATAADVLNLVRVAHDAVHEQFGVDLEREIIVLGEKEPGDQRD